MAQKISIKYNSNEELMINGMNDKKKRQNLSQLKQFLRPQTLV
jgi:hypothetical protein